jgi:site-specific DNA-methyltransferase (adenine-specific)
MNTSGGGAVMGSFPYPRNGILKIDYEFILLFKKLGQSPKVTPEQKANSALTTKEWNEYFGGHWNFGGEKQGDGHIAMFPVELPRRLIKMFSFAGETVLDPFVGSGTTVRAARELGRSAVGYEINAEFLPAIKKRLGIDAPSLLDDGHVAFERDESTRSADSEAVAPLNRVASLERQVDPKDHRFGSVVELADAAKPKEKGTRVRRIIAADRLQLEDGGEIKLLGIAPLPERENAALLYLKKFVLNKPVFLKFDAGVHAPDGVLHAYVYLENKTFINAKMIKNGLVNPDTETEHRLSARFRDYQPKEPHV